MLNAHYRRKLCIKFRITLSHPPYKLRKSNGGDCMGMISGITEHVNGVLWGAPMIALMLISGAYFSARTGFMQLRRPREWLRRTVFSGVRRERSAEGVTPFQAMSSALAATLGTGKHSGRGGGSLSGRCRCNFLDVGIRHAGNDDRIRRESARESLPQTEARRRLAGRRDVLYPRRIIPMPPHASPREAAGGDVRRSVRALRIRHG